MELLFREIDRRGVLDGMQAHLYLGCFGLRRQVGELHDAPARGERREIRALQAACAQYGQGRPRFHSRDESHADSMHDNPACGESVLGEIQAARAGLLRAIKADPQSREIVLDGERPQASVGSDFCRVKLRGRFADGNVQGMKTRKGKTLAAGMNGTATKRPA
ncbi:MAG: hypothetical protein ABIP85_26225, partial [Chthoniobacteraceae bacterium]